MIKLLTDKQITFYLLKGYKQCEIDAYHDWLEYKYEWETADFEDFAADLEWESSEEFADIMKHAMERD